VDEQPNAPGTFWTHNEYRTSAWRTWVGKVVLIAAPVDCNGNGVPDAEDIAGGFSEDCNGNSVPDECDIAAGTSADCDGNGVPDECDPDCNGNDYPDACELLADNGLAAVYYDELDLTGTAWRRIDPQVGFDWGSGAPWPEMEADTFSVRWTGYVKTPAVGGTYTFFTRTDDGTRLWVNNQLVVDRWIDQAPTEASGAIALAADQLYPIRLEYYENGGGAVAALRWQPPGLAKVLIPTEHLVPGVDCNGNGVPDECDVASGFSLDADGNHVPDECEAAPPFRGDLNCDGAVDTGDIDAFVACVVSGGGD